jgi:hypothetical protein
LLDQLARLADLVFSRYDASAVGEMLGHLGGPWAHESRLHVVSFLSSGLPNPNARTFVRHHQVNNAFVASYAKPSLQYYGP